MDSYIPLLTTRQKEVLKLLSEGYTSPAMADKLCISINTIKTHLTNIYNILGITAEEGRDVRILAVNEYRKYIKNK